MVAFAQADDQENDHDGSISHSQQPAVPGLTPEQSSQLMALLQNIQLSKTAYNSNTTAQGSGYNTGAAAFTSFAGVDTIDHRHSLCLLSSISNWENTWIVDTGASDHMCHNKDLFISLEVLVVPHLVNLPNGTFMTVTHVGTVMINNTLVLRGVFYIPGFKYNLLSVSKLSTQHNFLVVFTPEYCIVQAPSMKRP